MSTHIILNSLMREVSIGFDREDKRFFIVEKKKGSDGIVSVTNYKKMDMHIDLGEYVAQTFGRRPAFTNALKYLEDEPKMKRGKERNTRDKLVIDWTNGVPFEVKE